MSYLVQRLKRERKDVSKFAEFKSELREIDDVILNYYSCLKKGADSSYLEILSAKDGELLMRTENIPKYVDNKDIKSVLVGEAVSFRESLKGLVEFNFDVIGYSSYGEENWKLYGNLL
jgi:hypothetical protein|tara:strand:- start:156 stop:509 length:354 start_codon:yes stop_codon:yes gene_type:complete